MTIEEELERFLDALTSIDAPIPLGPPVRLDSGCLAAARPQSPPQYRCDEFPARSMINGGEPGIGVRQPGLRWVLGADENCCEGGELGAFYSACGLAHEDNFLVVPITTREVGAFAASVPATFHYCNG
jgi:hypothetical protein